MNRASQTAAPPVARRWIVIVENYRELQGLTRLPYAAFLLLAGVTMWYASQPGLSMPVFGLLVLAGTVVFFVGEWISKAVIRPYYDRTFGVVQPRPEESSGWLKPLALAAVVLAVLVTPPLLGWYPALGAVVLAAALAIRAGLDWRRHRGITSGQLAGIPALLVLGITGPGAPSQPAIHWAYWVVFGVSVLITGVLDHLVLVKGLPRPPENESRVTGRDVAAV